MLFRPIHTSCSSTPAGYVEDQIKLSESYYQETLEERQQLIARWGPSPSQLQSFPTNVAEYTLWNYFPPAFQCPHRTRRIGTLADGGKWVCGLERIAAKKNCVIYSVGELRYVKFMFKPSCQLSILTGISKESSFEASLLEKVPGCQVYGYDYSVKSVRPIHLLQWNLCLIQLLRCSLAPRSKMFLHLRSVLTSGLTLWVASMPMARLTTPPSTPWQLSWSRTITLSSISLKLTSKVASLKRSSHSSRRTHLPPPSTHSQRKNEQAAELVAGYHSASYNWRFMPGAMMEITMIGHTSQGSCCGGRSWRRQVWDLSSQNRTLFISTLWGEWNPTCLRFVNDFGLVFCFPSSWFVIHHTVFIHQHSRFPWASVWSLLGMLINVRPKMQRSATLAHRTMFSSPSLPSFRHQ